MDPLNKIDITLFSVQTVNLITKHTFNFTSMKKLLLFLAVMLTGFVASAQTTSNPWALGLGGNFPDFKGPNYSIGSYLTDAYWQYKGVPIRASFGRNLNKSFNVEASFNMVKLDNTGFVITNDKFWDADLALHYKLANGYIISNEDAIIDPYLYVGGELAHINENTYGAIMGGVGTNIWITPKVGVYAQAAYDHVPDFTDDYFHFAFGLKFRFGAKDRDKDGIVDKKDKCPDVAGLKVFEGCPDTDKDGIEDAKDLCPNEAGKPELQGCPDKDNDGIADKDDRCPDVAGLASLKGCPDKDGDGVADIDDRCPEVKGLANLKGCPDKDGDGIADKDDKCPEVAGVSSNNGCPEVKEEIVAPVAKTAVIVYFDFNGTTVTKEEKTKLDNFSKTMAEQKEATFNIDGFADSKGNDDYNMKLSQKRADAVVKYLKKKGINVKALEVKAYGEANPVGDNETEEGRAKNRRVEVKMK